ncbi:MAG TPA: sigma 54-interacting transcriptional regulator [Gemmatimonadales bacterium]|jgi:DNA-binding NtrC family response regulator|nr:sigma 54-interacting transcriptional regulator [Gemmatimonadales bacterium]
MPVRALRVTSALGRAAPEQCELGPELAQDLSALREESGPVALVFCEDDLAQLEACRSLLVDRGWKPASKPLAPLLLRQDKIPLIRGGHTSTGQLLRSVRALVARAEQEGDRNAYLVGADAATFAELWSRADSALPAVRASAAGHGNLSGLLEARAVPEQVRQRFVGGSEAARLVHQLILRAAEQQEPVLILGDTGSGKEVVAKLIHDQSARRKQSFTAVNCGAIPRELLESELFGYEKGAHSTATARKYGLWQRADGGTLFLDEIADLSLDHQVKIFRALEHGEIRPVGSLQDIKVDARVIAATNRDLFGMMRAGEFREDLYYRLRAFLIRTPPLREHPEDVPELARHFWRSLTRDPAAELAVEVVEELARYRWPGNARELRMVLASLYGLFGSQGLTARHLHAVFEFEGQAGVRPHRHAPPAVEELDLHRVECLRQLRHADEVLRATQVALRPLQSGAPISSVTGRALLAALEQPDRELEQLCKRPLLLHGAFEVVQRIHERLHALAGALQDGTLEAARPWIRQLEDDFAVAFSTLLATVQRLLQEVPARS